MRPPDFQARRASGLSLIRSLSDGARLVNFVQAEARLKSFMAERRSLPSLVDLERANFAAVAFVPGFEVSAVRAVNHDGFLRLYDGHGFFPFSQLAQVFAQRG